jgi:hypothetical protein
MKIVYASLSALITDLKERWQPDWVHMAALQESAIDSSGTPIYTSWIILTPEVDRDRWAEWRLLVGRQRGELTESGPRPPEKLARLTEERLAEVHGWLDSAGLDWRDGIRAADSESFKGTLD